MTKNTQNDNTFKQDNHLLADAKALNDLLFMMNNITETPVYMTNPITQNSSGYDYVQANKALNQYLQLIRLIYSAYVMSNKLNEEANRLYDVSGGLMR